MLRNVPPHRSSGKDSYWLRVVPMRSPFLLTTVDGHAR